MTFHTQGVKLRQAAQQQLFNKALEDAESKLDEMEKAVSSDDLGKDLRSVKDLLHKHQVNKTSVTPQCVVLHGTKAHVV